MPSRRSIERFLAQKHIAVVGVSRHPKEFSRMVFRALRDSGYTLYPVNVRCEGGATVEDQPCYRALADVPEPLDAVLVLVPAVTSAQVVREALAQGVTHIWLHRGGGPGSASEEARELCVQAGVDVVDGACPLMFLEPVRGVHRFHRFLSRRRISA
jgi:uncharacterized protein